MKKERLHVNYEESLPDGYVSAFEIDAANKKTQLYMNLAALGLAVIAAAAMLPLNRAVVFSGDGLASFTGRNGFLVRLWIFLGASALYIVLHELTHGAAYALLTGKKLSFGISGSVAYCGVRGIFVYRGASLISLLAPFVLFDAVFLTGALLFPAGPDRLLMSLLFVVHFSGCVGDLYDTALLLFKFRDRGTLIEDTGPKQIFYVPGDAAAAEKADEKEEENGVPVPAGGAGGAENAAGASDEG